MLDQKYLVNAFERARKHQTRALGALGHPIRRPLAPAPQPDAPEAHGGPGGTSQGTVDGAG